MGQIARKGLALLSLVLLSVLVVAEGPATPASIGDPAQPAAVECPFLGRYYNLAVSHPDMEGAITGVLTGLVRDTLPIALTPFGETYIRQFDWWDPSYLALERVDQDLRFGSSWFPVNTGLAGDPYHFAVHWRTTIVAPAAGGYGFQMGSDDDSWMFVDGRLVLDLGGVHGLSVTSATVPLTAGAHVVDLYFAERHTVQSGFSFEFTTEVDCYAPGEEPCPHSQGYGKNHADAWPVGELVLGAETYDAAALLALLRTPVRGDASLILAHQLIAAKLNVAGGAQSAPVADAVADADALLAAQARRLPHAVAPSSSEGQAMVSLAETLDEFNNGRLTDGCG